MTEKDRVLLAYSGGLDTSCILAWLLEKGYIVYAFMADVGQEEDFVAAEQKALAIGASQVYIEDLRKEFVTQTVLPALQGNCLYEGSYLMGTALARPIIAEKQPEHWTVDCAYVAHGCTGKGNDQVRFELSFYALNPSIRVLAPWRIPEFYNRFSGRTELLEYAAAKNIPVTQTKSKPWSTDENLFHVSYEAGLLEDPAHPAPGDMWKLTKSLENASPEGPDDITLSFSSGTPVALESNGATVVESDPFAIFNELNRLGRLHGIGRIDIVENRFIGIKSRGCYESPGATILWKAHQDLEGLLMDREIRKQRDRLGQELSQVIYNGMWHSPERQFLCKCVEMSQKNISGHVQLRLYKGNTIVLGRRANKEAAKELYNAELSSMDSIGDFDPADATGFIRIQAMRLKTGQ